MSSGVWALILAAGEGSRLRSLTTGPDGIAVPKQFCSLRGGPSLLEDTLSRAQTVVHPSRIVTVVAEHHRIWWEASLWQSPRDNVVVQPEGKGTGPGLLLPLLHIAQRDPAATVVVLPADHFVGRESVLARSMQQAVRVAKIDGRHVHLLGLVPEFSDPELGYIVPAEVQALTAAPVRTFVEKPRLEAARELISAGALWNAFILAASARALLSLYSNRHAWLLAELSRAVALDAGRARYGRAARAAYPSLPALDFSRDVLEGQEDQLRVIRVPKCGWSDLGTPERVAATLARLGPARAAPASGRAASINLAAQHLRLQAS